MNIENLERMAAHIETIPQELFDMQDYRRDEDDKYSQECNSVGCAIGHCTILNKEPLPKYANGKIYFALWGWRFTRFSPWSTEWRWCFSSDWSIDGRDNTPTGCAKRIRWLIKNGIPNNWFDQMSGQAPLCYV